MLTINNIEKPELISQKTKDIITKAGAASDNPSLTITSGIRSPQRQAQAMYNNLNSGVNIRYAAAGQEVIKVFNDNRRTLSQEAIVQLMTNKINELSEKGKRVSLHCVSEAEYKKLNIIDVSRAIPNPRDFVKALIKEDAVTRVITPFSSNYNSAKVSIDTAEQAIHVEIKQ